MQSRGVDHAASDIVRHRRSVFERMSPLELSPKRLVQNRDAHVEERLEGPFRQAGPSDGEAITAKAPAWSRWYATRGF
jgi:hypothetical protein